MEQLVLFLSCLGSCHLSGAFRASRSLVWDCSPLRKERGGGTAILLVTSTRAPTGQHPGLFNFQGWLPVQGPLQCFQWSGLPSWSKVPRFYGAKSLNAKRALRFWDSRWSPLPRPHLTRVGAHPHCMLRTRTWPGCGGEAQGPALHPLLVAQPVTGRRGTGLHHRPGHWPVAGAEGPLSQGPSCVSCPELGIVFCLLCCAWLQ